MKKLQFIYSVAKEVMYLRDLRCQARDPMIGHPQNTVFLINRLNHEVDWSFDMLKIDQKQKVSAR